MMYHTIMVTLVSEHAADILCDVEDVGRRVAESCKNMFYGKSHGVVKFFLIDQSTLRKKLTK
jgi:hypothetical protein